MGSYIRAARAVVIAVLLGLLVSPTAAAAPPGSVDGASASAEGELVVSLDGPRQVDRPSDTITLRAVVTDAEGAPVADLVTRFLRDGPAKQQDDTCPEPTSGSCVLTDAAGAATYSFVTGRTGTLAVGVAIYDSEGTLVGAAGPHIIDVGLGNCRSASRCDPPTGVTLRGRSDGVTDVLGVRSSLPGGSKVVLQARRAAGWEQVGRVRALNKKGDRIFRVRDRNGGGVTRYRARVWAKINGGPVNSAVVRLR